MSYLGKWRAQVTRNDDPERRGRIKARVFDILADDNNEALETDWALPAWTSHRFDIPAVGTGVWIEFQAPAEAPHFAIWTGMYPSYPDGISEVANVAQEPLAGTAPYARGAMTVTTEDLSVLTTADPVPTVLLSESFIEPESLQATVYPNNQVLQTPGGITEECDDTPNARRYHRQIGQHYVEETEGGTELRRCSLKMEFVLDSEHKLVNGAQTHVVGGTTRHDYEDDLAVSVLGRLFAKTGPVRLKLSSVDVKIDHDGTEGAEVFVVGKLDLAAMGEASLQGLRATLLGVEEASVVADKVNLIATGQARLSGGSGLLGGVDLRGASIVAAPTDALALTAQPVVVMSAADLSAILTFLSTHIHPLGPGGAGPSITPLVTPTAKVSSTLKAY